MHQDVLSSSFFFSFPASPRGADVPSTVFISFFPVTNSVWRYGRVGGWAQGLRHKAPSVAREANGALDVCEVGKFGNFTKASWGERRGFVEECGVNPSMFESRFFVLEEDVVARLFCTKRWPRQRLLRGGINIEMTSLTSQSSNISEVHLSSKTLCLPCFFVRSLSQTGCY